MSAKEIFLTEIAEKIGLTPQKILRALAPYNIINAIVENLTHINGNKLKVTTPITTIPIIKMYANIIFSHGTWEGNKIIVPIEDPFTEEYNTAEFTFAKEIRLSVEDLFVYEHVLIDLESEIPDIFTENPTTPSKAEETQLRRANENLYALFGIFIDMLVDKRGENILANPDEGQEYIFKNQADLIARIENYEIHGLKKSSLEAKFHRANMTLKEKMKT